MYSSACLSARRDGARQVTKLDLMDAGTHAGDILNNRVVPLRLGYVGVINRSQEAIENGMTVKEHLGNERKFLEDPCRPPLSRLHGLHAAVLRVQSLVL